LLHNWQDSLKLSNQFIYKENINALYATYAYKLDNIDIKAGLRSENLHTEGDQITQQTNFTENYLSLFPNFNMSYKLSDMYQIGFNAFRRVTYPQIYYVNPFRQYEGPNSYLAGNPDLKPSYTSSFAFNFSQYINIYYTDVTGNFTYATSTEQDSILISSYINLNEINTYGIDLAFPYYNTPVMPFHLPEFISMVNIRFSYLYSKQTGQYLAQDLSMINKSYTLRANLGLKLWLGIDANISIYYRPRTENKLSVSSEYKNLYLYLSKTFMDKKLRISISATDLLNSSKMDYSSIGANYYTRNSYVPLNSRGIGIGISYMFNDFKERQDRNIDDGRDAGNKGGI
jgi:hypothetical protein